MTVGIIDAVDPNAQLGSKELAVVSRSAATLRNTGLSISELGAKSDALTRQSLDLMQQLARVPSVIDDDNVYANAGALLGVAKQVLEQSEIDRTAITKPILELKSAVDSVFNAASQGAFSVKTALTIRISDYLARKRKREHQALHARQEAIAAEARRLASESANQQAAESILRAAAELQQQEVKAEAVESHGIKTGTATVKNIVVDDVLVAAKFVLENARPEEAYAIIVLSKGALKEFVKRHQGGALEKATLPGISVVESDIIRNF